MKYYIVALLCLLLCISSKHVLAYDATFTISQAAMTAFANVVRASGNANYSLFIESKCIKCVPGEESHFNPASRPALCPPNKKAVLDSCIYNVGNVPWSWKVISPTFVVSSNGRISLKGLLMFSVEGSTSLLAFELPTTAAYNREASSIDLHVRQSVEVVALVMGLPKTLGKVDFAPYFNTSLSLKGAFNNPSGTGIISVNATDVLLQCLDGSIKIIANINCQ